MKDKEQSRYPWSRAASNHSSDGMLSLKEVAIRLQIHGATVRRWCLAGQLEHVRINNRRFFIPVRALAPGAEMARMQRKIDRLLDSIKALQARVDRLTNELRVRGSKGPRVRESAIVNPQSAIVEGTLDGTT